MPATRLLFASGFLLLLFGMATLARVTLRASPQRAALFCGIVATSWLAKYAASDLQWSDVRFDEALVLAPLVFAMLALPAWQVGFRTWMLAVAAVANVAAFAFFNPIQSARPIFADHSTSLMQELAQEQAAHPRGWLVRGGFRGSVLNGMGFRAINHALILPEVEFFRPMFPQLTDAELNAAFNRYGMISPALRAPRRDGGFVRITRPVALPTAVWVPEEPFRMESEAAHGRRTEESDPGFEAPARGAISPTTR